MNFATHPVIPDTTCTVGSTQDIRRWQVCAALAVMGITMQIAAIALAGAAHKVYVPPITESSSFEQAMEVLRTSYKPNQRMGAQVVLRNNILAALKALRSRLDSSEAEQAEAFLRQIHEASK